MAYLDNDPIATAVSKLVSPLWLAGMIIRDALEEPSTKVLSERLMAGMGCHATMVARYALNRGANPNLKLSNGNPLLLEAAMIGHKRYMNLLLNAGADVNRTGKDATTPLIIAAQEGKTRAVELLLAHNADPLSKDRYSMTARDYAARYEYTDIVSLLTTAEDKIIAATANVPASGAPLTASASPDFNDQATNKPIIVSAPLTLKKIPSSAAGAPST